MKLNQLYKWNNWLPTVAALLLLTGAALLASCGGGGNSTPPSNQDPSGLYTGTASVDDGSGGTLYLSNMNAISYNNRVIFFSTDTTGAGVNVLYDMRINAIKASTYSATVDLYDAGVKTDSTSVSGSVTHGSRLTGVFNGTKPKLKGSFDLTYQNLYARGATSARIKSGSPQNPWAGPVSSLPLSGPDTSNLEILDIPTGVFSFQSAGTSIPPQCDFSGNIGIPDAKVNIYSVLLPKGNTTLDKSCPLTQSPPDYTGLATVVDSTGGTDNTLWFAVTNGTNSVYSEMTH